MADPAGSDRAPEAIALLITQTQGVAGRWLGGPARLTGSPEAPAPAYRAAIADRAGSDWPRSDIWEGKCLSLHRDAPGLARGLVVGLMNVAPKAEAEFNDWYETEHMPRLSAIPGVLVAARYRAVPGHAPAYLALYQVEALEISQSPAWIEAARTPWSARVRRFSSDYRRYAFTLEEPAND